MKFDLIKPCNHCPFRTDGGRIGFTCRERAEEIEEIAYREGFVCHEHGETVEHIDESGDEGDHIDFRSDGTSQHCFGALFMYLRNGSGNIPWEQATYDDEELELRWWNRISSHSLNQFQTLVFEDEEAFLAAND